MAPNQLGRDGAPCCGSSKRHWLGHLLIPEAIATNGEKNTLPRPGSCAQPLLKEIEVLPEPHWLQMQQVTKQGKDKFFQARYILLKTYERQPFKNKGENESQFYDLSIWKRMWLNVVGEPTKIRSALTNCKSLPRTKARRKLENPVWTRRNGNENKQRSMVRRLDFEM